MLQNIRLSVYLIGGIMLETLLPLIGALGSGVGSIRFVREGERAIMLRFDKAIKRNGEYRVISPGLRMMIPSVHKLARIHVRQRTINFPAQTIVLSDQTVFDVSAVLICRVKDTPQDLYNALFETTGIDTALTDYGLLVLRDVLTEKRYQDLSGTGRQEISHELLEKVQVKADEWGVEVLILELSDSNPSEETARLIQTSAQTSFRVAALQEAASELGLENVSDIPPGLAATLIGAPLVTTASSYVEGAQLRRESSHSEEE
jgi:regulator of protease activity HflC (stomatin/prohibitin superfamily)